MCRFESQSLRHLDISVLRRPFRIGFDDGVDGTTARRNADHKALVDAMGLSTGAPAPPPCDLSDQGGSLQILQVVNNSSAADIVSGTGQMYTGSLRNVCR